MSEVEELVWPEFSGSMGVQRAASSGLDSQNGVVGGAMLIFVAAILVSAASTSQTTHSYAVRGIVAALGAGLMFGSMYIPYRKAYITGMNPLTFLTFLQGR